MHKALDVSLIEVTTISGWPKGGCGRLVEVAALDYYFWSLIITVQLMEIQLYLSSGTYHNSTV